MNKFLFTQTLKRFSLAVILAVCAMTSAFAQNAGEITLKMENAPLGKVMDAIENQSQYLFLNDGVDVNMIVDVNVTKATISATLGEVFAAKPVSWKIDGVNIYISTKKEDAAIVGRKVSGVVTDASGMPLIGAAILVKGTTNGASTDVDGKFAFELDNDNMSGAKTLQFVCLGYTTVELPLGTRRVFNVTMQDDAQLLEGTVVTALGIKRSEKALSYNVQKVDSDELLANKDANFVNSLNGKVAGLVINSSSSGVGGASKVVMRGEKSISKSSNALYVIDGVPMYTSAKDFYEKGIALSFEQWGAGSADQYIADNSSVPGTYTDPSGSNTYAETLSSITIAWDENATPAQKQERIITQKWIANRLLGNEAWADWRRTGYPTLIPVSDKGNKSNGMVDSRKGARRMAYPTNETTSNAENYHNAVSNLLKGEDNMSTRLWFDCNPDNPYYKN